MNAVIAYSGSIKPLDALECACGTPLTIEAHVIHTYPLEHWGFSFQIAPEQESFPSSLLGIMTRPVKEEMQILIKSANRPWRRSASLKRWIR